MGREQIPGGEAISLPNYAVKTENLSFSYSKGSLVLEKINLLLPKGEFVLFLGPNGAGKSTFFLLLTGMLKPLTGKVFLFGQPILKAHLGQLIAYLPQYEDFNWDYPISVWDVVLFGRYGHMSSQQGFRRFFPPKFSGQEHKRAVEKALSLVDMYSYRKRSIRALSGGERKRVFLARALAQQAPLLLLDEPLSGVDRASKERILSVLKSLKEEGITVMLITHAFGKTKDYMDRVVLLDKRVVASGSPETVIKSLDFTKDEWWIEGAPSLLSHPLPC